MTITLPELMQVPAGLGEVTWHDLFCGGGGSSLGLHHVPGFKVIAALNHWDLAVQAHQANFPDTDHEVTEIQDVHPSRFPRARCGWFSPSCTHHAYCRGSKDLTEEGERSRATMWDVCRWTEHHRYDVVVVENVVEVKLWDEYESWKSRMATLGYVAREVYFNSQHSLVPQSRDRLYVVFTRVGLRQPDLDFAPPAYCSTCETVVAGIQTWKRPTKSSARGQQARLMEWGRYGTQYLYTCPTCTGVVAPAVLGSWSVVDHNLPIATIGSRKKPIAQATRKRIKVGLERLATTRPIQLQVGGNLFERPGYARVWSLDDPLRTVTTTPYMAMCIPQKKRARGRSLEEPMGTVTTRSHLGMVLRAGGQAPSPRVMGEPTMTLTAHDRQVGVLLPNMNNNIARHLDQPMPAVTTGNRNGYLVYNGVPGFLRVLDDAAGTVTSRDKQSLLATDVPPGEVTEADIDECLFRMLKWPELQKAQAMHVMPDGSPYQLTARVRTKRGTYRELSDEQRVKMIGNAVSSPVAQMVGHAIADALAVAA